MIPLSFALALSLRCRPNRAVLFPATRRKSSATPPPFSKTTASLRSPTHLLRFRRSPFAAHLTELNLRRSPHAPRPDLPSRLSKALASAGAAHESNVLARLRAIIAPAAPVVSIPRGRSSASLTEAALASGAPIIHQPALSDGVLHGFADVLVRNSDNPFLAPGARDGGYSVFEIKLASVVKADFALQAAAYTEMLAGLSARLGLPPPGPPFLWLGAAAEAPVALPGDDARAFYSGVRKAFDKFLREFREDAPWPEVNEALSEVAPWVGAAEDRILKRDGLAQVAGIRREQVRKMEAMGIGTMKELAGMGVEGVLRGEESIGRAPLLALQRQARLQVETREGGKPVFEIVTGDGDGGRYGLHRLPGVDEGDVHFDMEGFPLVEGGLEYLLGAWSDGRFRAWWAHDREREEAQFVEFVEWLSQRWEAAPGMHVFHYGHYEVTAMQRVASRAETASGLKAGLKLENMIEDGLFVDVYRLVKASLMIGEPNYSIKSVEKLVGVSRADDELADAESSVAMYYEWRRAVLERDGISSVQPDSNTEYDADEVSHHLLRDIELYNKQDCQSLDEVVAWLRRLAIEHGITYAPWVPAIGATEKENMTLLARGACGGTSDRKLNDSNVIRSAEQLGMKLLEGQVSPLKRTLAHLLGFHVRETGPARAQFGDRVAHAASHVSSLLFHDDQCLSDVRLVSEPVSVDEGGAPGRECHAVYEYDACEPYRLLPGDSCAFVRPSLNLKDAATIGSAERHKPIDGDDAVAGFVRVVSAVNGSVVLNMGKKLTVNCTVPDRGALVLSNDLIICPASMRASIYETAKKALLPPAHSGGISPFVSNYLKRIGFLGGTCIDGDISCEYVKKENLVSVLSELQDSTFVIQGPPGTGKTVTSASAIAGLILKHGKTVAVSSNSHAAIDNLLAAAVLAGVPAEGVVKVGQRSGALADLGVRRKTNFLHLPIAKFCAIQGKCSKPVYLVGGTAYSLSSLEAVGKFDLLFIDEAGQVPMANFVALAPCASSAVLVGDQQQLEMPMQGRHPEAISQSCLTYFLGDGVSIVPPWQGLFLETSFRMAPSICAFLSRSMYSNALLPADNTFSHAIDLKVVDAARTDRHFHGGRRSSACLPKRLLRDRVSLSGLLFVDRDEYTGQVSTRGERQRGKRHFPTEIVLASTLIRDLIGSTVRVKGKSRILTAKDIMVVAPYNIQVTALIDAVPAGIRVGTIDKFQGQEAPVVIISSCVLPEYSKRGQDVALNDELADSRGTWFVLNKKRLNVALSRAQCLAIVVGPRDIASRVTAQSLEDAGMLAFYDRLTKSAQTIDSGPTPFSDDSRPQAE